MSESTESTGPLQNTKNYKPADAQTFAKITIAERFAFTAILKPPESERKFARLVTQPPVARECGEISKINIAVRLDISPLTEVIAGAAVIS